MRLLYALVFALLTATLYGQDIEVLSGQAIGHGAVIHVADLEAKVSRLEAENESLRQQIRELTKDKEPEQALPTIKLWTLASCPACDDLEDHSKQRYVKTGWVWKREIDPNPKGTYPQIQICTADSCSGKIHVTKETIDAVVNRFLGRPVLRIKSAVKKRWGQNEGHDTPSVVGMSIEYHLTEHHGVDITGMTVAEMEAKHQELHR